VSNARQAEIDALVAAHLAVDPMAAPPPGTLPLAAPSFGAPEVAEAIDSLLSGWVTMGKKVAAFEAAWAEYVGVKHAVMVNSGSSALLVMLAALRETERLAAGDEVLMPAVSWSTDVFAIAQAGLVPVLVDVDPDTLCIEGHHDRPVLATHMLGAPSQATSPLLLEDACGAHGAEVGGAKVGSRGHAGVFSFFFSHHLTTVEGGVVVTSDDALADACRSVRAHGWVRERHDRARLEAAHADVDPRFLFVSPGYNLRPTEISGAFGIHQIPRLDGFVAQRRANHADWCARVAALDLPLRVFPETAGTLHAGFAFPMLLDADAPLDRAALCNRLEAQGIATRPISGSNLARQPAFPRVPGARVEGPLPVADAIHDRGLFVGNSHAFGDAQGDVLVHALRDAFAG
jgi:CDP-4-dehydro-6-deoxyglucose reductase, E1